MTQFADLEQACRGNKRELAERLAMSPAKISRWLSSEPKTKRQPSEEDARLLGYLSAQVFKRPEFDECKRWMTLSGHRVNDDRLAEQIAEESNLERRVERAFQDLTALATRKGLPENVTRIAFSAYFGQQDLRHRIIEWVKSSQGRGQVAFFWEWRNGEVIEQRFGGLHQTWNFFNSLLNPDDSLRSDWPMATKQSPQIHVSGFFLDTNPEAENKLREIRLPYLELLRSGRLHFYLQRPDAAAGNRTIEHLADAWLFLSAASESKNNFGMLASETPAEFRKILESNDKRLKENPWKWASQLAPLRKETLQTFLTIREVQFEQDALKPIDRFWRKADIHS